MTEATYTSASGGPSVIACSAKTLAPTPGCDLATGNQASRVGIHALNFPHPAGDRVTTSFEPPSTYGDTKAVAAAQSGRAPLDHFYRKNAEKLDLNARTVLTGNGGMPPGRTAVT